MARYARFLFNGFETVLGLELYDFGDLVVGMCP